MISNIEIYNTILPKVKKKVVAVIDLHGPLLSSKYLEKELCEAYITITQINDKQKALNWAKSIGRGYEYKIHSLWEEAQRNGVEISQKEVSETYKSIQYKYHYIEKNFANPYAKTFLESLNSNNVTTVVLSGAGTTRKLALDQLEMAGLLEYVDKNNVIGLKSFLDKGINISKDDILEQIHETNADSTIFYFENWVSGIETVIKKGGIVFGFPQKLNYSTDKKDLIDSGTHFIVDNLREWKEIINLILFYNGKEKLNKHITLNQLQVCDLKKEILKINVRNKNTYSGKSLIYFHLTKYCHITCKHCICNSEKPNHNKQLNSFTPKQVNTILDFVTKANTEKLVITGGGEPFLSFENLIEIIGNVNCESIVLITSGYWAKSIDSTKKILAILNQTIKENKNNPSLILRISIDNFHLNHVPLSYCHNIINVFSEKYSDSENYTLMFHTLNNDSTYVKMIEDLVVKDKSNDKQNVLRVTLKNNYEFGIEFAPLIDMYGLTTINNADKEIANINSKQYLKSFKNSKCLNGKIITGLHIDENNEVGFDYLINYDGSVNIWGTTHSDSEQNIFNNTFPEINTNFSGDIITTGILEKGLEYFNSILSEFNKIDLFKAKASFNTDEYMKIALKNDQNIIYVAIRMLNDFTIENRINSEQLSPTLHFLLNLSHKDLNEFIINNIDSNKK